MLWMVWIPNMFVSDTPTGFESFQNGIEIARWHLFPGTGVQTHNSSLDCADCSWIITSTSWGQGCIWRAVPKNLLGWMVGDKTSPKIQDLPPPTFTVTSSNSINDFTKNMGISRNVAIFKIVCIVFHNFNWVTLGHLFAGSPHRLLWGEGFDPRLGGVNTGAAFGIGCYFTTVASWKIWNGRYRHATSIMGAIVHHGFLGRC